LGLAHRGWEALADRMVPSSGAVHRDRAREHEGLVQEGPLHGSWGSECAESNEGGREEDSRAKDGAQDRSQLPGGPALEGAHEVMGFAEAPGSRGILGARVAGVERLW
jgi:hypothetical protein